MKRDKLYVIRSISMMSELIKRDFELISVGDDKNDPKYKIFLFEHTKELRDAITEISNN